jgi:hypothetical protein
MGDLATDHEERRRRVDELDCLDAASNMAGHRRLLHAGGWDVTDSGGPHFQPFGARQPRWPRKLIWRPRQLVCWLFTRRFGGATAWALARPAPE